MFSGEAGKKTIVGVGPLQSTSITQIDQERNSGNPIEGQSSRRRAVLIARADPVKCWGWYGLQRHETLSFAVSYCQSALWVESPGAPRCFVLR
jgi:hypothetical protein